MSEFLQEDHGCCEFSLLLAPEWPDALLGWAAGRASGP